VNKKVIILAVVLLAGLGGAYKFVLAKPKKAEAKPKVAGEVYILQKEFLLNLADGKYAKLQVALVMPHLPVAAGGHGAPTPPEGYGVEPQEAIIRDLISDVLTDANERELIGADGREKIKKKILHEIHEHTDVHVEEVLFPDFTVQ
jgi:flagellar basal body-associated protein FliL